MRIRPQEYRRTSAFRNFDIAQPPKELVDIAKSARFYAGVNSGLGRYRTLKQLTVEFENAIGMIVSIALEEGISTPTTPTPQLRGRKQINP